MPVAQNLFDVLRLPKAGRNRRRLQIPDLITGLDLMYNVFGSTRARRNLFRGKRVKWRRKRCNPYIYICPTVLHVVEP
jgi:hypothetical protein